VKSSHETPPPTRWPQRLVDERCIGQSFLGVNRLQSDFLKKCHIALRARPGRSAVFTLISGESAVLTRFEADGRRLTMLRRTKYYLTPVDKFSGQSPLTP
jgi:hypothetical protein